MHITLAVIGKLKPSPLKTLYDEYHKRLHWKVALIECEGKASSSQEGKLLLDILPSSSFLIILDEKGENLTSEELAKLFNEIQLHHQGKVTFIIGGADGLSEDIKAKANLSLSFGQMTWPHQMVRVLLMEQLYRTQQILSGHPYHRG